MSSKEVQSHEQMGRLKGICDNMVTALDDAFNTAIKTKEKEFLLSYRDHINEVQQDLDKMRDETEQNSKNFVDMRQERVNLLEEKLEYYRQATTHLDQQCQKQRKQMKTIKKKVQEMQEDHDFYEKQIKKERKQSSMVVILICFIL